MGREGARVSDKLLRPLARWHNGRTWTVVITRTVHCHWFSGHHYWPRATALPSIYLLSKLPYILNLSCCGRLTTTVRGVHTGHALS